MAIAGTATQALALPIEVAEALREMQAANAFGQVRINLANGCIESVETRRIRKVRKVDDQRSA